VTEPQPIYVFSVFDENQGASSVMYEGLDDNAAHQVSVKVLMAAGASSADSITESSAVLPFLELGMSSYSYFFTLPCQAKRATSCIGALSFFVEQSKQTTLFQKITNFNFHTSQLIHVIRTAFTYSSNAKLDDPLRDQITYWARALANQLVIPLEEEVAPSVATQEIGEEVSPYLFMRLAGEGAERIVNAVLTGSPVVIAEDSSTAKAVMASLEAFAPRELKKVISPKSFVAPTEFDILVIESQYAAGYINEPIIYPSTGKIEHGTECNFSKRLLDEIQDRAEKNDRDWSSLVQGRISYIDEHIEKLLLHCGGDVLSQFVRISSNPRQEFKNLSRDQMVIIFQAAYIRHRDITEDLNKLSDMLLGKNTFLGPTVRLIRGK
jgi:hypothetical protein